MESSRYMKICGAKRKNSARRITINNIYIVLYSGNSHRNIFTIRTTRPPLVAGHDRKKCPPRALTIMPIIILFNTYLYSPNKTPLGLGWVFIYYIILLCIVRARVFVYEREREHLNVSPPCSTSIIRRVPESTQIIASCYYSERARIRINDSPPESPRYTYYR